ncbi:MAG TPA: NUDIX hydrolase [Anaerovoracaceae bacterium]|nr:NUDIX hydrolase [Anaerovoracaceae bacterium]
MWTGGVRVVIPDEEGRILMVKQSHEGKDIWMVPGGAIEAGENAVEAAVREVLEETGLEIRVKRLLWHVEEVSETRGQRFVNFFLAEAAGGSLVLGTDPEFDGENQVLREARFLSKKEILAMENVYPEYLKTELWEALEPRYYRNEVFKVRK